MSKLSKVLSVLLAMVLLFSSVSIGVEAVYSPYKDDYLTRYDAVDRPVLDVYQYASMALDEVDRMLGEANLKIKFDVAGMFEIKADLTSIDSALDAVAENMQLVKGALSTIGGDIAQIDFSALVNMDSNPVSLNCPKRTTSGKTDVDIILALLKFLKDNAGIIAKVPKGSAANGGLDLGPVLSNFVDLGDKLDVVKMAKQAIAQLVWPDTAKDKLDLSKTLDQYVQLFIDEFASGDYADYKEANKTLAEYSKLVEKYLPGLTDQIDLLNNDVYTLIDKGIKIALNNVAIPYLNPRIKAALNRLCGYDYYKTKDEDGDTIWKRVEENPQDEINAMVNVINLDFNLDPFPIGDWGEDWIFDHLNDIVGLVVREAIKSDIKIDWNYEDGNAGLRDNVIAVAKTILKNTGDALFADYIEVLTPEQIDDMDDEPFMAYVLRSILNASISYVYITNENETVLEVLFELVKQMAADFVPWRDYSNLDADLDGIMEMGIDMAVYGLKSIVDMEGLEYGMDKYDFADVAMDWVIQNYGGFVNDVVGDDGWEKLSYVIFKIIPANWLSQNEDGLLRNNIYDLLVYDVIDNVLDLNFDGLLTLLDKNPTGELNNTLIKVILARLTNVVNYVLPGVFPNQTYSTLESLLDPNFLSTLIQNLLNKLYDRANTGLATGKSLLNALLPVLCAVLDLSDPESFGYPYISLEDDHTVSATELTSFYMYNGSSGINTNATDKYGNTPSSPDKLYTYEIKSVKTNNDSVRVSPTTATINGGTSQTFTLSNIADAVGTVLKVTITYDVKSEKGTVMTPAPLTATTYTYIYDSSITEDDEEAKADANDKNMHVVKYVPTTYLSKGSTLDDIADYTMTLQRNKYKDSTLHNEDATMTVTNVVLDDSLASMGVTANTSFSMASDWRGIAKEYAPFNVPAAAADTELPEGTYANSFYFNATKTEAQAENIGFTSYIFVYDDFGLRSLVNSAVNANRQKANYGSGSYEAKYLPFGFDTDTLPKAPENKYDENGKETAEYKAYLAELDACYEHVTVRGSNAWNAYVEALDAAAEIAYAPRLISSMQTFVDNGDFENAAYNLYVATKELDACSVSGGTAGIKSAVDAIVAPDTFINEYGEEETYEYDDPLHTYFGRADYISYTYSNFKSEKRAADRAIDAEKEAAKKGETYQIEAIRAAYLAHRVSLYGERLVRVRAYKTYLNEAIEKYTDLYNAGQGEYSNKTWNAFTKAYNFATSVNAEDIGATVTVGPGAGVNLEGEGLRQTKVNEARAQLVKAAKRLTVAVPTVDYTQINALIEQVKPTFEAGNDDDTYTELSWNTFVSAYRAAVSIVADELELTDANQAKVNGKYDDLQAAFNGLTKNVVDEGDWGFSGTIMVSESLFCGIEYVTGLEEGDWVEDYFDYDGSYTMEIELNEWGLTSTGAIVRVYKDGDEIGNGEGYPVVFYSDVNGDGECNLTDFGELVDAQGFAGLTTWETDLTDLNPNAWAADLNHDGTLDGTDNSVMADYQGYACTINQAWVDGEEPFWY